MVFPKYLEYITKNIPNLLLNMNYSKKNIIIIIIMIYID